LILEFNPAFFNLVPTRGLSGVAGDYMMMMRAFWNACLSCLCHLDREQNIQRNDILRESSKHKHHGVINKKKSLF